MKKLWVVRISIPLPDAETESLPVYLRAARSVVKPIDGAFLECLRYAGVINLHRNNEERQVFDIFPPKSSWNVSQEWAEMNAKRMQSFGFLAAAAPSTSEPEEVRGKCRYCRGDETASACECV